jgi:arylsulfatase A-like enzyme
MLGNHGHYAKSLFYEDSAKIPLIIVPTADYQQLGHHTVDDRLVTLADIMPTLLDLCHIPIPDSVEGISLTGDDRRHYIYGEQWDGDLASRMVRAGNHKLIYYPVGNHTQLFDLDQDPNELVNRADEAAYAEVRQEITEILIDHLYGDDLTWLENGRLVGLPDKAWTPQPDRGLGGQRGWRFM